MDVDVQGEYIGFPTYDGIHVRVNPDHSKFKQSGQSRWRIDTKIEQSPLKDT